jgi:hypothetical protein
MRKILSVSGKQVTIIITMAAIAVFSAWYYFAYIPGNEKDLNEQHFRWLQRTDINIRAKVDATDSLLSNLLLLYKPHLYNKSHHTAEDFRQYSTATMSIYSYKKKDTSATHSKAAAYNDSTVNQFYLGTDSAMKKLIVSVAYRYKDSVFTIAANYDVEQFFQPVLEQGTFDHYVIFYKGRYIYEDFHSGLGYDSAAEDSLLKTGKWITGASIVDQEVGGVPYKMFLQPINFFGSGRLIIAGLHTQKRFDAEKKQLPPNKALLAIIIAVGILLLFPWIRLYFIGKYDRLTLGDAAESLLVAKLLMSLIVLLFFKYYFSLSFQKKDPAEATLATKISGAFSKEIKTAYDNLGHYDSCMTGNKLGFDIIYLGNDSIREKGRTGPSSVKSGPLSDNAIPKELKLLYKQFPVTEVNWMDSVGNIKHNWTTAALNSVHGNYSDRDYFKDITNNNTIRPDGDSISFTLEQVISRTSGDFKTVICKKSVLGKGSEARLPGAVVLMDWSMKSLDKVIMPSGFSFAIIDGKADVKYHSNSRRNLNENLLDEFSEKEELQEALQGRFKEEFTTNYYEASYSVRITPIHDYPYFIVIMNNKAFADGVDIETFAFSWGMILFFLLTVLVDLFIVIASSSRRSLFKRQSLVTSWLWPRKSSRKEYLIASAGNSIMAVLLIVSLHFYSYLACLFLLLICIPLLTIFLNTLFLLKYRLAKEDDINQQYKIYKVRGAYYSSAFLLVLNIIALVSLQGKYGCVFLFELIFIAVSFGLLYLYGAQYNKEKKKKIKQKLRYLQSFVLNRRPGYLQSFALMAITKLLVTSAIPVVFFYIASFNFEQNLLARSRQYDYAFQLKTKFPDPKKLADTIKSMQSGHNTSYSTSFYTDNHWIDSVVALENPDTGLIKSDRLCVQEKNTAKLFNNFGSYVENISGLSNDNFYRSSSDDSSYYFNNFFNNVLCNNTGNKLYMPLKESKQWLKITTTDLNYKFPGFLADFKFWMLLLLALAVFYIILCDIIKKVCSLDTRHLSVWKNATTYPEKFFQEGSSVWMVGAHPSALLDTVLNDLKEKNTCLAVEKSECVLDFNHLELSSSSANGGIELHKVTAGDYRLRLMSASGKRSEWDILLSKVLESPGCYVCVLHFESNFNDEKTTAEKLKCIRLLKEKRKNIVVISSAHPFYLQQMMNIENSKPENIKTAILFNDLFADFPLIVLPLADNSKVQEMTGHEEFRYTPFLHGFTANFDPADNENESEKRELADDRLVLRIQSRAHNFYASIWQSLSADEKFILYDLASDGLVNIKNRFAINLLINKGLIIEDEGHLHLFNRSFRHFIVSAIGRPGRADIDLLYGKSSKWGKLRTPLLIVVIAIFIFLAVSQEGTYTTLIKVLGSVTAGVPLLFKLISMVGVQGEKRPQDAVENNSVE